MSEPDSSQRRRPPTIDLTAKEVENEGAGSSQNSAAADGAGRGAASSPHPNYARHYAIGILVGVIAAAIIIGGLWVAGFVPTRETANPPSARAMTGPAASDEISSRLDKIQRALQAPRPDDAVSARVMQAEAQTKVLNDALAALTHRVDDLAAASQNALTQAKGAVATADAAKNAAQASAQHGDIDALAKRIAALEDAVKSLTADLARRPSTTDDKAARATLAAEALRAAVERSVPYEAELAAVKSLGADQSAVAALAPFAADGVPSAATLGHELAVLIPALRRASEIVPRDGSILGRLEASAQKLVRVTPLDASAVPGPVGDDPSSVIGRISAEAGRGDVAAALSDIARLPDAARAPAQAWVKKAEAREAAIAASRRIAADALAALAKPAAQ
jgi:hypothetical protein